MSELKIEGKIYNIWETQQVTDTFSKREFVIETNEQYAQYVKFELTQKKCDELDNFAIGQAVKVHFNVRGRKWLNKEDSVMFFVSLNAWRIEAISKTSTERAVNKVVEETKPPANEDIELPF